MQISLFCLSLGLFLGSWCIAASAADCCRYCHVPTSKACGDACIPLTASCHVPAGCACNSSAPEPSSDPTFDHQTVAYKSQFQPVSKSQAQLDVMPYFSPDHSAQVLVDLIDSATETLDIFTPGFSSWSHCTTYNGCSGCPVSTCNNEKFPVFPALLNALNRGVKIRIITNNFEGSTCDGLIAPLDFLVLAGVQVKYYTTTTFMHAKFMVVDGKRVSISSVNWTRNSILNDREAGVVVSGTDVGFVVDFVNGVYSHDWSQATDYKVNQTYSSSDMAIIQSKDKRPVIVPAGPTRPDVTPTPSPISVTADTTLWTSPDFSYPQLMHQLDGVKSSFDLYIYQVTDTRLCQKLEDMVRSGIQLRLLVSKYIYGDTDYYRAKDCYEKLYAADITIRLAWSFGFSFYNHQKFWIIDNSTVTVATGNWSPSDYPGNADETYPPHNQPGWQSINRDFTIAIADKQVVDVFATTLNKDYTNATNWQPYHGLELVQ
eukprot:TRINITY_DN2962_c0_g1_i1.p1 TRINITY_DN2962_c0_g1~~TRINITY_DN2962_c0_g1_i1.p1  ORF type:complete len:487 (+),score=104.84 TRINITY_DN2962_c0_g1_i1:86-1546(+)